MTRYILGADPGQTTGLARLNLDTLAWDLVQVTPEAVLTVAAALGPTGELTAVAIEKFVVGPRAARSSSPKAGQITRDLVGALSALGTSLGAVVVLRSAADVKPWGTNTRLSAAGLRIPPGMGHGVDAARHALFEACHSGQLPDPLSTTFRRQHRSPR